MSVVIKTVNGHAPSAEEVRRVQRLMCLGSDSTDAVELGGTRRPPPPRPTAPNMPVHQPQPGKLRPPSSDPPRRVPSKRELIKGLQEISALLAADAPSTPPPQPVRKDESLAARLLRLDRSVYRAARSERKSFTLDDLKRIDPEQAPATARPVSQPVPTKPARSVQPPTDDRHSLTKRLEDVPDTLSQRFGPRSFS
jgi:hypothetical protein